MENILDRVNVFNAKELVEFLTAMNDRIRVLEKRLSLTEDFVIEEARSPSEPLLDE